MMKINKIKQIVLVDDDPDYGGLVETALLNSAFPCQLKSFLTGGDFISWLTLETTKLPHLILMDIHMPITNGLEVLKALKSEARFKSIPVVMLTVSGRQEHVRESYFIGANAFMVKPEKFDELNRQMQLVGHYWFDVAQTPSE